MYGIKAVGIIAYKSPVKNLAPYSYILDPIYLGIWYHTSRPTTFTLSVNNFGIKYFHQDNMNHLLHVLRQNYSISTYLTGSQYYGLPIK